MDRTILIIIAFLLGISIVPPLIEHLILVSSDSIEEQSLIK